MTKRGAYKPVKLGTLGERRDKITSAKKAKLVEGLISGLSFYRAWVEAGIGGGSPRRDSLRVDPEVLAAIEDALEKSDVTKNRLVAGVLEIAEHKGTPPRERIRAWELLAKIRKFLDEAKSDLFAQGGLTVVFEDSPLRRNPHHGSLADDADDADEDD